MSTENLMHPREAAQFAADKYRERLNHKDLREKALTLAVQAGGARFFGHPTEHAASVVQIAEVFRVYMADGVPEPEAEPGEFEPC